MLYRETIRILDFDINEMYTVDFFGLTTVLISSKKTSTLFQIQDTTNKMT